MIKSSLQRSVITHIFVIVTADGLHETFFYYVYGQRERPPLFLPCTYSIIILYINVPPFRGRPRLSYPRAILFSDERAATHRNGREEENYRVYVVVTYSIVCTVRYFSRSKYALLLLLLYYHYLMMMGRERIKENVPAGYEVAV